jgi:hypothetical protein
VPAKDGYLARGTMAAMRALSGDSNVTLDRVEAAKDDV